MLQCVFLAWPDPIVILSCTEIFPKAVLEAVQCDSGQPYCHIVLYSVLCRDAHLGPGREVSSLVVSVQAQTQGVHSLVWGELGHHLHVCNNTYMLAASPTRLQHHLHVCNNTILRGAKALKHHHNAGVCLSAQRGPCHAVQRA